MNGYVIALIVFIAWIVLLYALKKTNWLERHNMTLMGPLIMWRTRRGKAFVDRLASAKRFWGFYGKLALWICAGAMVVIMTLLLWEATIVPQIESPPSPELILGIPGINPVIPVGYGILGLIVAIVIHELAHGIQTRLGQMKIDSMGLLFLVFPMGAFVEPNEKELQTTSRGRRSKVFAAGPASNIIMAMIMLALFSGVMMSSVKAVDDGALAVGVVADSPAEISGITPSCVVTSIGGVPVANEEDFSSRSSPDPGAPVVVEYLFKGEEHTTSMTDGIVVGYVAEDFAAYNAGMTVGMVFVSLNSVPIGNTEQLSSIMSGLEPGQTVPLVVMSYNVTAEEFVLNDDVTSVTLSDKYDYYQAYNPGANKPSYQGVAYLGGGFLNLGIQAENTSYYADILANPFQGDDSFTEFSQSWLRLIALPFLDLAPIRSPVTDLYTPSGWLAWMPDSAFWLLTNSFYWIFWLNLMVGLTNVLPAVPLDGGYLFRDGFDYLLDKTGKKYSKDQKDRIVGSITLTLALFVLFLIVWQLIGPALV